MQYNIYDRYRLVTFTLTPQKDFLGASCIHGRMAIQTGFVTLKLVRIVLLPQITRTTS